MGKQHVEFLVGGIPYINALRQKRTWHVREMHRVQIQAYNVFASL